VWQIIRNFAKLGRSSLTTPAAFVKSLGIYSTQPLSTLQATFHPHPTWGRAYRRAPLCSRDCSPSAILKGHCVKQVSMSTTASLHNTPHALHWTSPSNSFGSLIDAHCSMLPKAWFGFCIWYFPITNRLHSCNIIVNFHDALWTLQRQKRWR